MVKIKFILNKIFLGFLCIMILLLCISCKKYYWDYDCFWISEQPQITLNKGCGSGKMKIENVVYEFYTYISNDATHIGFYNNKKDILWEADTNFKDDCLYLTIKIDNISNYKGQVIKLNKSLNTNL